MRKNVGINVNNVYGMNENWWYECEKYRYKREKWTEGRWTDIWMYVWIDRWMGGRID